MLDKKKYKKLNLFLEENNLHIISTFRASDLDCSYAVVDRDKYSLHVPLQDDEFYVSFYYEAYRGSMFSWGLTDKPCMSEDDFIKELDNVNSSVDPYRPNGSMKD